MRRLTKDKKKEEVQGPTPAQKDGDGAPLEPSFEGTVSDRTFSRREAVGLTGAALAGFATLVAAGKANPVIAAMPGSEVTSPQRTAAKPDENIVEVSPLGAKEAGTRGFVPGLGNVTARAYAVGSSATNNRTYRLAVNLTTAVPAVVQVQPRQLANQEFNFPDQFAVQVITTAPNVIVVRVRRLDANGGWGQNLRLDLFVVDSFVF